MLYHVWRRWIHISWHICWRLSVICVMYAHYFLLLFVFLLFFIYGDNVYRRSVAGTGRPGVLFSVLFCKMATKYPQNDTKTQQRNPAMKYKLKIHMQQINKKKREYLLNCRIVNDHGSLYFHAWVKFRNRRHMLKPVCVWLCFPCNLVLSFAIHLPMHGSKVAVYLHKSLPR